MVKRHIKLDDELLSLSGVRAVLPWVERIEQVRPLHPPEWGERVLLPDGTVWQYRGVSAYKVDNLGRRAGWEDVTMDFLAKG